MTTSGKAYQRHVVSGQAEFQRQRALDLIVEKGSLTGAEADTWLGGRGAHVRLSELYALRVVEVFERPCTVTGRKVRAYRLRRGK